MKAVIQCQKSEDKCNYFVRSAASLDAIAKSGALIVNSPSDPAWNQIKQFSFVYGEVPNHLLDIKLKDEYKNLGEVEIESVKLILERCGNQSSMNSQQVDIELIRLTDQFNNIAKEIHLQKSAIYSRFDAQAKYVVLGVESMEIIQRYAKTQEASMGVANYQDVLNKYFNLIGIVDVSLFSQVPKEFVQALCPSEVYES